MREGQISIYYGQGKGKTCLALGRGIRAIGEDLQVVMIQFLEIHSYREGELLKKFEPEFRLFRFEKNRLESEVQDEIVKKEISAEVKNAFNFAKKIADTGECEMLILDGILDCVEQKYLEEEQIIELLGKRPEYMDIILTGSSLATSLKESAGCIYEISAQKNNRVDLDKIIEF